MHYMLRAIGWGGSVQCGVLLTYDWLSANAGLVDFSSTYSGCTLMSEKWLTLRSTAVQIPVSMHLHSRHTVHFCTSLSPRPSLQFSDRSWYPETNPVTRIIGSYVGWVSRGLKVSYIRLHGYMYVYTCISCNAVFSTVA